jgi:hypothetical protein
MSFFRFFLRTFTHLSALIKKITILLVPHTPLCLTGFHTTKVLSSENTTTSRMKIHVDHVDNVDQVHNRRGHVDHVVHLFSY